MNKRQAGFGGLQLILAAAIIAGISLVAIPKYKAFVTKSKITEALNLAGESRRKLAEFYMVSSRFPSNDTEAATARTTTLSKPKFVRDLQVKTGFRSNEVAVLVYLNEGVVDNPSGDEQYIYLAGNSNKGGEYAVAWSCGSSGIPVDLLPDNCKG